MDISEYKGKYIIQIDGIGSVYIMIKNLIPFTALIGLKLVLRDFNNTIITGMPSIVMRAKAI